MKANRFTPLWARLVWTVINWGALLFSALGILSTAEISLKRLPRRRKGKKSSTGKSSQIFRCVIYIRVSSKDQLDGWSLEAQLELCKKYAIDRGWEIVFIYEEPAKSAKTDKRPAFQKMIQAAIQGDFDCIIVHKLDRFSRSLVDVVHNIALLEKADVALFSVSEAWINSTTETGKLMLQLFALLAQWDNENRAKETSKGKQQRASNGYWNGSLPFGYMTIRQLKNQIAYLENARELSSGKSSELAVLLDWLKEWGDGREDGDAIPHYKNAKAIGLIFQRYSMGDEFYRDIALALNANGYRTTGTRGSNLFDADAVRTIIQNSFYLGEVVHEDTWIKGRHPALISQELFDICQKIRVSRQQKPLGHTSQQRVYPLAGLAVCGQCEHTLRAEPGTHRYFRDPNRDKGLCSQKMIRAEEAEKAVMKYLSNLRLSRDLCARILELADKQDDAIQQIRTQRAALKAALERAKKLYQWGEYTEKEFNTHSEEIEKQLAVLHLPETQDPKVVLYYLENIDKLLEQATPDELKKLFNAVIDRVHLSTVNKGLQVVVQVKPFIQDLLIS